MKPAWKAHGCLAAGHDAVRRPCGNRLRRGVPESAIPCALQAGVTSILAAAMMMAAATACATEGGGSVYPYGLNTVASGVLPKAGTYLYNYNAWYSADTTRNDRGASALPHFRASVHAHTLRLLQVADSVRPLGGEFAWLLAQPWIDGSIDVGRAEGSASAFGDLTAGVMIGWHGAGWHAMSGVDFTLPTGEYSRTRLFNPGRNQYAATPYVAVTTQIGERIDANLRAMLTVNGRNRDTDYESGIESGFDYSLNLRLVPRLFVGVNGYLQLQITDDEIDGKAVAGTGRRAHVFAYGPQLTYRGDGWGVSAKLQHETSARNKAEGDKLWLQLFFKL